jgi:hypothetical protein
VFWDGYWKLVAGFLLVSVLSADLILMKLLSFQTFGQ